MRRLRVAHDIVITLHPLEHGGVWTPCAPQECENCQPERNANPADDTEQRDPDQADDRLHELARSQPIQPPHATNFEQPETGGEDDRRERGLRCVSERLWGEQQQPRDDQRGDDTRRLCLRARGFRDRGARPGCATRLRSTAAPLRNS
ncbi:MAG: hypothetical protein JWQ50_5642 [Caballeronia mineralivorans]|jgi:hypothetical protein|nr:hypothetical protein [Caballeronia mineralivorans]